MWVQSGLQATGFYFGAIDGAIGQGTRASIRDYQAAIGDPVTGALTGRQINDLVAVSSTFAPYINDPIYMHSADLANDLDPDQVAQVQAALNNLGYNAGVVDGAFGGNTRTAIADYKADQGLPGGAFATRRLLAQLTGTQAPEPDSLQFVAMAGDEGVLADSAEPMAAAPAVAAPAPQPAADLSFDLVGITLGMREDAVRAALAGEYGPAYPYETVSAESFGGDDKLTTGALAVQPDWPAPSSEQFFTLYDATRPELGLIAAVRMIRMPETVDRAVFEAQVLPGIIEKYGEEAMFGNGGMWVGGGAARTAAQADANQLMGCGSLRLASIAPASDAAGALWSAGGGVTLDPRSLGSVTTDCGEVLSVTYHEQVIRIALWNATALSNAVVAPAIKF